MKDPRHNIDDLFYKGLQGHSEHPDDSVWNNIEAELDKDVASVYKRKYKIVKRNALVLLILLFGFLLYEGINLYNKKESAQSKSQAILNTNHPARDHDLVGTSSPRDNGNVKPGNETESKIYETSITRQLIDKYVNSIAINKTRNKLAEDILIKTNDFGAIDPGNTGKTDAATNDEPGIKNDYNENNTAEVRSHSFFQSTIVNESWKKDLPGNYEPVGFAFATPLQAQITAKEISKPDKIKESGFFISAYFSGAGSWSSVTTEDRRRHRGGSGNNNGNNGGNNGGNNNGGGNNGNNNGGNNGNNGSNSSGNNGPNSGGGGRGGRGNYHDIRQSESANMAWSGGVKLGYNLNKKLSLQTGLNYFITSTSVKPKMIYAEKDDHGNVGYRLNYSSGYSYLVPQGTSNLTTGDSIIVSDTRNSVSYIGVPLMVQYRILSAGRFNLRGSAGGQFNILLKGYTKSVVGKGTSRESTVSSNTEGLKSNYLSALVNLEAELRLNKDLSITLSPFGQIGLTNINKKSLMQTRPNYAGAAAGLKLKL